MTTSRIEERPTDSSTAITATMTSSPSNNAVPGVAAAAVPTTTTPTTTTIAAATQSSMAIITDPHMNDVLSGPGLRIHQHVGNIYHRTLIDAKKTEYLALTSIKKELAEKARIVAGIVHTICTLDPPGRFLRKMKTILTTPGTPSTWYELDNAAALTKTRKALTGTKRNRNLKNGVITVKKPSTIIPWNVMLHQLTQYKNEHGGTFFIPSTDTQHQQKRRSVDILRQVN